MKPWLAGMAIAVVAAWGLPVDVASGTPRGEIGGSGRVRLLDVPYVPQSEALCGGAAVAMVLRYWGERSVLAEDFASLQAPGGAGIRTDALVGAVRERGWTAFPVVGNASIVQHELARGRPVIALIGVRSGTHHYVVVVAWANGGVIVHDPALGPFRVSDERDFDAAWARAGRWALLIVPPPPVPGLPGFAGLPAADSASARVVDGCDAIVAEGIRLARGGQTDAAEVRLLAAGRLCPASPVPLRELAGLRFLAEDWDGAARLARRALDLDAADGDTWRLLAGSLFLDGDMEGALGAWNQLAEPRNDLTRIAGLERTRYRAVFDQLDLEPRRLITPGAYLRARRRLAELPAQTDARLGLKPLPGGAAEVTVSLLERPLLLDGPWDVGAVALHSVVDRDLSLNVASPAGLGELWTAEYRWWEERPRFRLELALPAVGGRPGIWRVEGLWERQTYATPATLGPGDAVLSPLIRERRHRASLAFSDWVGPDLRLEVGVARDEWVDRGAFGSTSATFDARLAGEQLGVRVEMAGWAGPGGRPFQSGGLLVRWGPEEPRRGGWQARLGGQIVTAGAPLALWPGAGTGHARLPLLRAHPLLDGGVVTGPVFGRALAHGGIERISWPWTVGPLRLGWALFVDGAGAWETLNAHGDPLQLDGGLGLRFRTLGRGGQLRVDVARGVRDGATALSVGWQTP